MTIRTETKRCKSCGAVKILERFHKNEGMADGRYNTCKICMYAEQQARRNREKNPEPNAISQLLLKWGKAEIEK